ncbi:MAG: sodium:solute symporter [Bacteroidia bacterium]|nr:sodium:solute symporter [Bacteroidales bacterium]NCD41542.1 sodium:solute symporter [Bacteroidia bacterium]MDD2323645.1 sodium:solute symporter [Bacteroidales bacterium]MDD3011043.1 sodium:solute symporter [Bacteroidales bacterium]MDD3961833.1 sodium:solute symporter [Bacteroidales bacterium]
MTPLLILTTFLLYTGILFFVSWLTTRKSGSNSAFFSGNHQSPWMLVAYGMIGASLSGVTFISVPGDVLNTSFSYMLIVFGYLVGYLVIAKVLMPVYYRMKLTSIYSYLGSRFGIVSYKTGSFFFLLSRVIGASFRMYLVVNVLHLFVFKNYEIPFIATVAFFILLILIYTFRGGIKTIVWTDTLQTTFMLGALVLSIALISKEMGEGLFSLSRQVFDDGLSRLVFTDINSKQHFLKQFFSGMFITIVMTGLDQDMMQKNLTCRNLKDAQKNMFWMSASLVPVNFIFLMLGGFLILFARSKGMAIPSTTDDLFPLIALQYLGPVAGIVFIIGLISAAYSSADSALTSLTTAFCVDFLNFETRSDLSEERAVAIRKKVHIMVAFVIMAVIAVFHAINDASVISKLFTVAGYTYGPLLGLFSFGLFTRYRVIDHWIPLVAFASPVICYILSRNSADWFNGYHFGFELLIVNGLLTFAGLWLLRKKS